MKFYRRFSILEIKKYLNVNLIINSNSNYINGLSSLEFANNGDITFISNKKYLNIINNIKATAIIVDCYYNNINCNIFLTDNVKLCISKISFLFYNIYNLYYIFSIFNFFFKKNVLISKTAIISDSCFIGNNVIINDNVIIYPGVFIGDNCIVGSNTIIYPNVVLFNNVRIGYNCIIYSNSTIGSDGFSYILDYNYIWVKIYHFGGVKIYNNVNIGSNTSIDCGFLRDTIIFDGVMIDNQVQIGHNVIIGSKTIIAGCVGIGGSTRIGKKCFLGGGVGVSDNLELTSNTKIIAGSGVSKSIFKSGLYSSSFHVQNQYNWNKNIIRFYHLDVFFKKIMYFINNKINLFKVKI